MQRSLSLIQEQDGLHQESSKKIQSGIGKLLKDNSKLSESQATGLLDEIREAFITGISHAEERVALAEHIHQTVKGHIVKLEDDLKHFEEEVRLAKHSDAHKTTGHHRHHQTEEEPAKSAGKGRRSKSKEESLLNVASAAHESGLGGRKRSRASMTAVPEPRKTQPPLPAFGGAGKVEPTYCYCGQPAYGEMIGCDGNTECNIEWFHYGCVGLESSPTGQWFCPECNARMAHDPIVRSKPEGADGEGPSGKKPRPTFVK